MTLRPEYALGHSQYNAFLFAAIGEEDGSLPLTVLSALSRLDVDPWQEAARLAALPKEAAARALAVLIARLPPGDVAPAQVDEIAVRLVEALPKPGAAEPPAMPAARARRPGAANSRPTSPQSRRITVLVWAGLAVAALVLALTLQPSNELEPERGFTPPSGQSSTR